ncbi:MAG TPA: hypothetical protein PLW09_00515 [Candidatus Kapabacteria bacterium]|nr:hypothetical protein [Candidatus Kapabacteria bacterium]
MDPDNSSRQFIINAVPSFGDVLGNDINIIDLPNDISVSVYEQIHSKLCTLPLPRASAFRCTIDVDGVVLDKIEPAYRMQPAIQLCM